MATIKKSSIGVSHTISGNSPQIVYHQEGAAVFDGLYYGGPSSGGFRKGCLLYVNSSNALEPIRGGTGFEATGADAAIARIIGFAAEPATQTNANELAVYAANADNVFYGNVVSTTSGATSTISLVSVSEAAGASINATGSRVYVNPVGFGAASSVFRIVGKHPDDAYGDTNGRALFQILGSRSIWT